MKQTIKITIFLLFVVMSELSYGQLKHIGLTRQISLPERNDPSNSSYHPKCQIIVDSLYVSTNSGIYKKDLTNQESVEWELFAFEGMPITEFVKSGDSLLAISTGAIGGDAKLLLLSENNGKTYMDFTSPHFFEHESHNYLFRIAQNPQNPQSLLILHLRYGVSKSTDFGKTWRNLNDVCGGYQDWFVGFHPLDTTSIFYCGEYVSFNSYMCKSFDNGETWSDYSYPGGDNCMHHIAFHPSDPNILISSGEGIIAKSVDKGQTWKTVDLYDTGIYFYKVLFDETNPSILYATGAKNNDNDKIRIFRSLDMGDSWQLAYKENIGSDCGGVIDMVKYKDKLIFYTLNAGLFELDVKKTKPLSIEAIHTNQDVRIYPNPVLNKLYFDTEEKINKLSIVDLNGQIVKTKQFSNNENSMDVTTIAKGIYFAIFYSDNKKMYSKKIYISN